MIWNCTRKWFVFFVLAVAPLLLGTIRTYPTVIFMVCAAGVT
jgi:hypothetical protein